MELTWTRRYAFQSVHKLDAPALRERTHGHQYFLEVTFTGDIDATDAAVGTVLSRLHGKDLGFLEPASGEHIVDWIHGELSALGPRLKAVALQETRKNRFISASSEVKYV